MVQLHDRYLCFSSNQFSISAEYIATSGKKYFGKNVHSHGKFTLSYGNYRTTFLSSENIGSSTEEKYLYKQNVLLPSKT